MKDLKQISKDMREQDNRSTQYPLYVVQELVKNYNKDGSERERVNASFEVDIDSDDLCDTCKTKFEEGDDIPDECDACDTCTFVSFDWERKISNESGVFLTEKACQHHIDTNNHRYNEPRVYVISAWRNPEMVAVMQSIIKLTGDDIPSHYR